MRTVLEKNSLTQNVLILGAAGRFGAEACRAFDNAGWTVFAQARKGLAPNLLERVQFIHADVLEYQTILEQLQQRGVRIDLIVHALNPDYARWDRLLLPITEAVLALAKATGATVMIPGNVYNFGRELPQQLTEETPFIANTAKAAQRIAMERVFKSAADEGVRTIVIRAGDFIGGSGTWLDMAIAKSLHKGVFTSMGNPQLAHAWAYLPDLARTFVMVAQCREQLSCFEVLHYPGLTVSQSEILAAFESLMAQPLKVKSMPWTLMRILGWVSPLIGAVVAMRYLWQQPHQLSGDKLRRLIGPLPQTSLHQVLGEYLPDQLRPAIDDSSPKIA